MTNTANEVSVAFASDSKGILPLKVALWSVLESASPETVCSIYVLCDGMPEEMQEELRALGRNAYLS